MADIQSNIQVNIDTSEALASIKSLQRQISAFHTSMAKSGAAAAAVSANLQQNLINSLNATGKFAADMRTVRTSTESFTNALEKNKLTMREYFRYAGGSTKTFGRLFKSEFDTIEKVARERVKTLQTQYIKMGRDANGAMKAIAVRPLALDMENLATKTQIAAQRQQLLNQLLKQGSTNLLNFGKNTQWAGRQLMVGFTVPLMYLGTAASKTFMKLEEQAIRFKRVYGEMFTTGQETDKMLKEIQLLAKEFTKYGVAVEKTMEMAATAAASGKMGAELLAQVNQATRLAVLGGVEQEQALETTISLTNAFGVAAEDLTKKINFLNAVENQTVVSIEDLTIAIPKAGPVVQQLGGDVEDLAFFLTAMKEGGINASEGANALKSGLASLINPTEKASKMLGGMGINIKGIVEANKGNVKGVVVDFAKALDTLDPLNRARAIEQLFGKFQFSRLSTLFQNVIAEGNQASRVLTLTQATTEELAILAERELKRVEESPMYKFKKAVEDLKVTLAPVGEAFLKAVTPIVEFVSKILDKFNNLGDGAKNFVVILTTVLAGIGPVALMTFGLLANGIANIIKLFTSVKSLFNRVGQSSQTLGAQTQYMTQEQLEAAAVASSLDQVHNKLTQTFTSEANALSALVAAYQRAIAAQAAFRPMTGFVPGRGPQKFNKGTVGVRYYARGTDTVPSMLTPGEAVIPAGPAQDPANKPAIKFMIGGGRLSQFANGSVNVGGQSFNIAARQQSTVIKIQNLIDGTVGQIDDILQIALQKLGSETKINLEQFKEQVRLAAAGKGQIAGPAFAKSDWVGRDKTFNARGAGERRTIQNQLVAERGAPAAQAELDQANAAAKAIEKKMTALGATTKQITAATQLDRAHVIELNNSQKRLLAAWNSDVWVTQTGAENNLSNSLKSSKKNRELYLQYLSQSGATEAQIQAITTKVTQGTALVGDELMIQGRVLSAMDRDMTTGVIKAKDVSKNFRLYAGAVAEAATARTEVMSKQTSEIIAATKRTEQALKRGVERIAQALPIAAEQALEVRSPSRRMKKIGQESGRGLVLGATEFIDDAKVTGKQLGTALLDGARTQSQKAVASRTALYGTGPIDPMQKSLRRQIEKQQKLQQIQQKIMLQQSSVAGIVAGGAGVKKPTPGDSNGDGVPDQKGKMGAGGAMMAASGVMMAASMAPGKVGEVAQKLMMPLMTLTMLLPLIQSPLGAFAVGLTAVVAATIALRMAFDKAQDTAMKMAEAMGSGEKAIQDLSEFAGTARAGEIMDKRRASALSQFQIQTGKTTFGESYVQSEGGKALISNVAQTMKTGGKQAAQSQLLNQLATGIASGAINPAQARSIAANIASELGDYSFGIQVNAKLIELIGVNGENLMKDPLQLRLKLVEESRKDLQEKAKILGTAGTGALTQTQTKVGMAGYGIAGAVAGGVLGSAATGAAVGSVVPVVGTAIGAAIGATIAAGALYFSQKGEQEKLGRASGANVAMQKMALEQSQEMQDSLRLEYEKRIQNAKAANDTAEAIRLQGEYEKANASLLAENGRLVTDIQNTYAKSSGAVKGALDTGVDKAITKRYKGTAMEDIAPMAKDLINDSALSKEAQYTLKMQVASGQMDPMQIVNLMEAFGSDKQALEKVMNIVTKFGGAFANQAVAISSLFVDKNGKPLKQQQTKFLADISAKAPADAEKYLRLFSEVSKVGQVVDVGVALTFYNNNPAEAAELQKTIDDINAQKGKISLEVATKILGAKEMEILRANQEYFNSLPPEQQKVYLQTLTTMVNMEGNNKEAIQNWLKANPGKTEGDYYAESAYKVTVASKDTTTATKPGATPGAGSKVESSPLDDIVKKLRDVRLNQIKVTEGWSASRKALDKLFGGNKTITAFSGIEQDMRELGAGQNLIELIVGMDPKEYEKRKNSLFKFDNKGNIVALKRDAKNIQEALNSVIAGDFQSGIQKQRQELVDQNKAYARLTQLGVPVGKAYELIADKSFRAMIATTKNKKELKAMIDLYKKFIKEEASSGAIADANQAIADAAKEESFTESVKSTFSFEEAKAIIGDPILKALYQAGEQGSAQFAQRLAQQMGTLDFMQGIFDDGFNKAMEAFDAEEKAIELNFQFKTKDDQNLIETAEDQIAGIQYEIDDWEYGLKDIEEQEKKINESYDAKFKALDQIQKINDRIVQQQKSQLTIADALSQGDIAAAARAVQEARAQAASNALDDQKTAMEQAKENAIAGVRNKQGFTRIEIENKVKDLQDQILDIEEKTLEPARERVRLAEVEKREAIQNLTVLGKSKLEWEAIKNGIDLARVRSNEYKAAMQAALDIVGKILGYWNELNNKTYTTYHKIITTFESGAGSVTGGDQTPSVVDTPKSGEPDDLPNKSGLKLGAGPGSSGSTGGSTGSVSAVSGTAPNGRINGVALPSGVVPGVVLNHLNDLGNIQNNISKNAADFEAKLQASKIADASGQVAAAHYMDLYNLSKQVNDANANKVTELQKSLQAAEKNLQNQNPILSNAQKASVASAAKSSTTGSAHLAQLLAAENAAKAAAAKKEAERQAAIKAGKAQQNSILSSMGFNRANGGIIPKRYAWGGNVLGTDVVPAMLTPGEFIMSRYAVDSFGVDNMKAINNGSYDGGSVYNYNLSVNVRSDANPDQIANTVMAKIRQVDSLRIRGNRI